MNEYEDKALKLNARQVSALLSGLDGNTYADGSGTRMVAADLRAVNALDRRGLITWRTIRESGRTWPARPYLSPFGRAEAKRVRATMNEGGF